MIISEYNNELGILFTKFINVISLKEAVDYQQSLINNKKLPRILRIFTNTTESTFNFPIENLEIIVKGNIKMLEVYDYIFEAVIVNCPKKTSYAYIYQDLLNITKFEIEIFSTKKAAMNWLEKF